jgi:hypothetical protein
MRITTQRYIYKNVFPIRPQVCIIIQKHLDFKVNIITFFAPPFHAATKLVPTTGEELNQFQGNWRGENQGYIKWDRFHPFCKFFSFPSCFNEGSTISCFVDSRKHSISINVN